MTALAARIAPPPRSVVAALGALAVTATAFGVGLAFGAAPIIATLAAFGLMALVVGFARPSTATYIVIGILYSNAAGVAVRDHGLPTIVGLAFPLLLALPLADHLLLRRRRVVITAALPPLVGYLIVQVIAAIGARDPSDAAESLSGFLLGGFGLYFVMTNVVRSFGSLRRVVWTVLIVAAAIGALTSFHALSMDYGNDFGGFSTIDLPGKDRNEQLLASLEGVPRHEGPIGETNRYGQVMLVLLPIGAMLALGERRRPYRLLALSLTFLVLCGMVSSFSRGAAVGLAVVLVVAMLFRYLKPIHLVSLGLVTAMLFVVFPRYGERLIDLQALTALGGAPSGEPVVGDAGNLRGRATSTLAALYVWADHPWVGVGRGQFGLYYEKYATIVAETSDAGVDARVDFGQTRQAHNLFTSVAAETGTLGLLSFLAIFVVTMLNLYRARRRWQWQRPEVAHLAMGFFLALVGYLVSGIALHLSYERYLWLLLALAGAAAHMALHGDASRDLETGAGWGSVWRMRGSSGGRRALARTHG